MDIEEILDQMEDQAEHWYNEHDKQDQNCKINRLKRKRLGIYLPPIVFF
jgi:hypothetical protein